MTVRAKDPLRAGLGRKFLMNKEYASVVNQLNTDLHRAIQEFMVCPHTWKTIEKTKLNQDVYNFR